MDGNSNFYMSVKTYGGRLTAVSGNTFEEFYANLVAIVGSIAADEYLSQLPEDVTDNPKRPEVNVTPSGNGSDTSRSQSQPRSADGPPPGQDAPYCNHGRPMEFRSGEKNGKSWSGHFCTETVKANQCPPKWTPKG